MTANQFYHVASAHVLEATVKGFDQWRYSFEMLRIYPSHHDTYR